MPLESICLASLYNEIQKKNKYAQQTSLSKTLIACVADVFKNLREGNETGRECEEKLTRRKQNWEGVFKNFCKGNKTGRGSAENKE